MTEKQEAALRLAREAFEYIENKYMSLPAPAIKAIAAIDEALAEQPANVAAVNTSSERVDKTAENVHEQPSKPWVGLTQQDIDIAFDDTQEGGGFNEFAYAIEAKLKEKNNG